MKGLVTVIGSALLGAGLVAAACAAEPARPATTPVDIRGFAFAPARVEVSVGDTVVWINRDALPHTATADSRAWDSGELRTGARWSWIPADTGTVEYICAYHPNMRGSIDVR
jgi:plastocyanin